MNILLVSAIDRSESYVAALHNSALGVLERAGHSVAITSLYSQQFNPVASKLDFAVTSGEGVNYMFEQQRNVNTGRQFSPDIMAEMEKVNNASLIIFHFPLWWGSVPAVMKGWFERVFAMGYAWGPESRYASGMMRGKTALLTVAAGDPTTYYAADGMHKATVEQHLYPITHHTLAFCGFDVITPYVIANTTASSRSALEAELSYYREYLQHIEQPEKFIYKH